MADENEYLAQMSELKRDSETSHKIVAKNWIEGKLQRHNL